MSLLIISSDRFADHQTPPGHPERSERAEVMDTVAARWREQGGAVVPPRAATREQLARVHDRDYIQMVGETAGSASMLDQDTYASPETSEVALLAAGAAVDAAERVMSVPGDRTLALVRPPGHHAERGRAMGFCFFNNAALAAAHARALGAARVAIVDYDVHHGNGTQHMFEDDPSVLYVSIHQYPFYPGSGGADEVGRGEGRGFTVNLPLEVGAADADYQLLCGRIVIPVLRQFEPDLIVISAGFDAHERDPLAGMRLTTPAFAAMTMDLRHVADECCAGRIAAVTEGGYDLRALAESLATVTAVLGPENADPVEWPTCGIAPTRGEATLAAASRALGSFWAL